MKYSKFHLHLGKINDMAYKHLPLIKIIFSRKQSHLKEGLKINSIIKSSFYNFIVDKHIDWAILLSLLFCTLPSIGSKLIPFLIIKVGLFLAMFYLAYLYIKNWDAIRKVEIEKNIAFANFREKFNYDKIGDTSKLMDECTEIQNKMILDLKERKNSNPDLIYEDYLSSDTELPNQLMEKMIEDKENTLSAVSILLAVYLILIDLKNLPKIKLINYYRLLSVFWLTVIYFIIHAIEVSIS